MSRLPYKQHRWTQTKLIDSEVGVSYQNPVVFQDPTGTIHLYHTTQNEGAGEANAHVLHAISTDNGQTWTKPELLFGKPGAFDRHPLLILTDNTWLLPMDYVTSKGIGEGSETNYSVTELTSDYGKTWRECVMPGTMGKVQPTVVQIAPGHLLAFLRSRAADWIYSSTSKDGCKWTTATPTELPNNNASVQLFKLRNGHIVLAFNNTQTNRTGGKPVEGLRKPLSVALSENNGQNWSYVRDVENGRPGYGLEEMKQKRPGREEYSYPTIIQTRSGRILIAYTFRRQTIKVVSFTEDWIRHGSTVGVYRSTRAR
jgi:predicted neuraminidase